MIEGGNEFERICAAVQRESDRMEQFVSHEAGQLYVLAALREIRQQASERRATTYARAVNVEWIDELIRLGEQATASKTE